MKFSEYYENHVRIKSDNGELVQPPKLTEHEKDILDNVLSNSKFGNISCVRIILRNRNKFGFVICSPSKIAINSVILCHGTK